MVAGPFAKMNDSFLMIDKGIGIDLRRVLAANVRRMRIARHLSLSELARAAGVGKATLSGVEAARANPTVETLAGLAAALRTSVGELLVEPPLGEIRIVRAAHAGARSAAHAGSHSAADAGPHGTARPGDGVPRRLLDEIGSGASVEVAELVLAPLQRSEAPPGRSGARAHVYVRAGTVLAGPAERYTELAAGDYASFPADVAQVYEAGRRAVSALLLTQMSVQ
jgi:transcriptional regulator with XRE-family HTH domain